MRTLLFFIGALALTSSATAQAQSNAKPQPPLIEGGALECPDHPGLRQFHSETATYKGISVSIWADSRRDARGCQQTANLHVVGDGMTHDFALPDAGKQNFSVVDFSPDGTSLLLEGDSSDDSDGREYRDTEVATVGISTGAMHWRNVWDLFDWGDCDASVEVRGFVADGKIVISARASTQDAHEHPNCVSHPNLCEVGTDFSGIRGIPNDFSIQANGEVAQGAWRTCESDPDIVAKCFLVHGRLQFYNGAPSARIWRIGTKRLLGVHNDILPGSLDLRMGWDVRAYGDFHVCPFTREKPGAMQFVCIESSKNVKYKKVE